MQQDQKSETFQKKDAGNVAFNRAVPLIREQPDSALHYFRQAAVEWQKAENRERLVSVHLWIAHVFKQINQADSVLWNYQKARELAETYLPAQHSLLGKAIFNCASVWLERGYYPRYIELVKQAIDIEKAQEQTDWKTLDTYFYGLSSASRQMGDLEEALRYYDQIILRQQTHPHTKGIDLYKVYFSKAEVCQIQKNYTKALKIRLEGLRLMEQMDITADRIATIYYLGFLQEIALNYMQLGQANRALQYLELAKKTDPARILPRNCHE